MRLFPPARAPAKGRDFDGAGLLEGLTIKFTRARPARDTPERRAGS